MAQYKMRVDNLDEFASTIPKELPSRPSGWSGLPLINGKVKDKEHLLEFSTPRRRAITVTKMLRTSAVLSMAEEYLTGRVTAVKFHVARGEGVSDEAADALELWLGLGPHEDKGGHCVASGTAETLFRHMMSARIYGNCAMSESYYYSKDHGLYFIKLHRRRQESYESYITADGGDHLIGIGQRIGYTGAIKPVTRILPLNETLWIVNRPDLGHWDGRSIFRSIYANWRSQALRYRQDDIAANHWASPPMIATLDVESFSSLANGSEGQPVTREDFTSEIASIGTKLKGLAVDGEGAHIVLPSWWKLEPVSTASGSYEPSKILASVSHHERVMAERLFLAFMQQGRTGSGGSYSMVSEQRSLVEDSVIDQAQWLVTALNHQTVKRFLQVNFSKLKEEEYPRVTFERSSIKIPYWQRDPQAFASFIAAGVLTPSEEDERAIRAASDLPAPQADSPSALDRQALKAGDRLAVPAGQREAANPGKSKKKQNAFVKRLIEREE
tara:strand:- start:20583 stop:22079 length:1497 start_codon:yes stop_codon:yes gene_type:complete